MATHYLIRGAWSVSVASCQNLLIQEQNRQVSIVTVAGGGSTPPPGTAHDFERFFWVSTATEHQGELEEEPRSLGLESGAMRCRKTSTEVARCLTLDTKHDVLLRQLLPRMFNVPSESPRIKWPSAPKTETVQYERLMMPYFATPALVTQVLPVTLCLH